MGANLLTHILGNEGKKNYKICDAAVAVQAPMNLSECQKNVRMNMIQKVYDIGLTKNILGKIKGWIESNPSLIEGFEKRHGYKSFLNSLNEVEKKPRTRFFDEFITIKQTGHQTIEDYWQEAGCQHMIKHIKSPTLFMNALDDPMIYSSGINFEEVAKNENTVLATHDIGGHMGYNQRLWGLKEQSSHAFVDVVLNFLDAYKKK